MAYELVLLPRAENNLDEAYNWYEEQRTGLGEEFLQEVAEYYTKFENHPAAFGKIRKNIRQAALKRFPFVIVYEIIKKEVVVFAVFHTSRNPRYKFRE